MSPESCNLPDNTFTALDIQLPNELKQGVLDETHTELMDCFIESLDVSGGSEELNTIFINTLKDFGRQEYYLLGSLTPDYIREVLGESLSRLQYDNPNEYERLRLNISQSYIIINGVSMNFHNEFIYYAPKTSPIPISRPDDIEYIITLDEETLTEFLSENGIPDSSKEIIRGLFEKYGAFSEDISDEDFGKIYNNLGIFIKFIVAVESSGGMNIKNSQGSSAKGPFQYLDGYINGNPTTVLAKDNLGNPILDEDGNEIRRVKYSRETGSYSPFDTALRRNMEYYASQSPEYESDYYNYNKYIDYIPEWVVNSYENQPKLSPLDLSWEESINMWLVDSFCRSKTQEYMRGIILQGDASDMKRFYNRIHHTAPDRRVNENVQQHFETFADKLTPVDNFIFSQRPVSRPDSL